MDLTDPAAQCEPVFFFFFFFRGDKTTPAHREMRGGDVRREEGRVKWSRGQAWEE